MRAAVALPLAFVMACTPTSSQDGTKPAPSGPNGPTMTPAATVAAIAPIYASASASASGSSTGDSRRVDKDSAP